MVVVHVIKFDSLPPEADRLVGEMGYVIVVHLGMSWAHSLYQRLKQGERNNHSIGVQILPMCKYVKLTAGGRSELEPISPLDVLRVLGTRSHVLTLCSFCFCLSWGAGESSSGLGFHDLLRVWRDGCSSSSWTDPCATLGGWWQIQLLHWAAAVVWLHCGLWSGGIRGAHALGLCPWRFLVPRQHHQSLFDWVFWKTF